MSWDDVNLAPYDKEKNPEGYTVAVRRQVLAPGPYLRATTKGRRERKVRFDAETAAALRAWKARQAEERLAFGAAYRTDGGHHVATETNWIATEPDGYVVRPDTLLARWKKLVKSAGVTPVPIHGGRHSYVRLAQRAHVRLETISQQLGHASISTTADIYGHDDAEAAASAAELVARMLEGKA